MGAPMAGHLAAAGFHVVAADANPVALRALLQHGAVRAGRNRSRTWVAPAAW